MQSITKTATCPHDLCDGSGVIGTDYYNLNSHQYEPDGDRPCLCKIEEEEDR